LNSALYKLERRIDT